MNSANERCLLIEIIIVFLNIIMGIAKNYMYRVISPVHMYSMTQGVASHRVSHASVDACCSALIRMLE